MNTDPRKPMISIANGAPLPMHSRMCQLEWSLAYTKKIPIAMTTVNIHISTVIVLSFISSKQTIFPLYKITDSRSMIGIIMLMLMEAVYSSSNGRKVQLISVNGSINISTLNDTINAYTDDYVREFISSHRKRLIIYIAHACYALPT